jgi:hypothetical protein
VNNYSHKQLAVSFLKVLLSKVIGREFDEPLSPSLPLLKGDGGARKYNDFKPLASQERGWGEVKF